MDETAYNKKPLLMRDGGKDHVPSTGKKTLDIIPTEPPRITLIMSEGMTAQGLTHLLQLSRETGSLPGILLGGFMESLSCQKAILKPQRRPLQNHLENL
ncbi:unnamed protein product [Arabis nemorensis]|uniref:Uncharacterized protein n=1 Tax=Arabis nemorensis TaxID=586526 RepID=A0A565B8Y2_9BRAS|nr:unnamed protein product [Arabis nemorensis]